MPLRRSRDLDFLLVGSEGDDKCGLKNYIYDALISCMITGFDERFWVSFAFDDAYYKGESNRESVVSLADAVELSMTGDKRVVMDPSTRCEVNADTPIREPREQFLRVFESQVRRAKLEWRNVTENLLRLTKPYEV
jgi:hypothetical protein